MNSPAVKRSVARISTQFAATSLNLTVSDQAGVRLQVQVVARRVVSWGGVVSRGGSDWRTEQLRLVVLEFRLVVLEFRLVVLELSHTAAAGLGYGLARSSVRSSA
jgi:hypothetical protein